MLDLNSSHITLRDGLKEIRLRRSLFWDIPDGGIDLIRNKQLIIERVFSRGNIEELKEIINYYSDKEIRQTVVRIGTLDKKTLNFIARAYHIKPEKFRCFTTNQ
ncbi:MAG: hypothetical protein ABFS38_17410 [Bacteroidota bacterium]